MHRAFPASLPRVPAAVVTIALLVGCAVTQVSGAAAQTSLPPADDPAVDADEITPGAYACYAQLGDSSSRQVLRGGGADATKLINADGTWRDTTYGSMTATNPKYGGAWTCDGDTLVLTWGTGSRDTFTPQIRTSGQPQLVEFGSDFNLTCYLVQ